MPTGKMLLLLVAGVTLFLPHSIIATREAGAQSNSAWPKNCLQKCGNVSIQYPFGIGKDCFLQEDFEVICENDQASISMGNGSYSKVLEINMLDGEVRIQNSEGIERSCNYTNNTMEYKHGSFHYLGNSMKLSSTKNKFTAIGCATVATIIGFMDPNTMNDYYNYTSSLYTSVCESFCGSEENISNECNGMGCCQTPIPGNMTEYLVGFVNISNVLSLDQFPRNGAQSFSPCSYAFIAEDNWFKFKSSDAKSTNFQKQEWVSLVLDWVVGAETCAEAKKNLTSYACKDAKSLCIDAPNGPGYRCNCSTGYEGNPYLDGGCQDINECESPLYPCINGTCINTMGSYDCSCPPGTDSKDPKITPCIQTPGSNQPQVKVIIGTSIGFVLLVIFVSALLIQCQKRKLANEKEKFFKQNGGNILYQQILSKQIDTVTIFTIEDLKKATNNYDRSRELGIGGHGTVYKGILDDTKVVAVKRSKIMNNVVHTEEFVQEIIILSQLNHRNVVRLLGCCLEVEVPILVYEYIPNGTLFQLIHGDHGRSPVSLEDRLRIAQESAEALEYLHLSINCPIVHGDVKSLNILLDNNYMAKVTDFGASRMLPKDAVQLMTMVQGTLGYLDPEYLQERKLTEKSDVYSFGVVLLEMITRKTAIYFEGHEEGKNLTTSFLKELKDNRVECMLDTSIMCAGTEELLREVVVLASRCLSLKGDDRPSMTQVADKLKAIRVTWREILLLKHEETQRQNERFGTDPVGDLSASMSYTAQMLGLDIETPTTYHTAGTASMHE